METAPSAVVFVATGTTSAAVASSAAAGTASCADTTISSSAAGSTSVDRLRGAMAAGGRRERVHVMAVDIKG
jgi:hypothetical protein